jgi:hypothetical protein
MANLPKENRVNSLRKMFETKTSDDLTRGKSSSSSSSSSKREQNIIRPSKNSAFKPIKDSKTIDEEPKTDSDKSKTEDSEKKTALVIDGYYNAKQELIDSSKTVALGTLKDKNQVAEYEGYYRNNIKNNESSIFGDTLVNAIHELAKTDNIQSAMEESQKYEDVSLKENEPIAIMTINKPEINFEQPDPISSEIDNQFEQTKNDLVQNEVAKFEQPDPITSEIDAQYEPITIDPSQNEVTKFQEDISHKRSEESEDHIEKIHKARKEQSDKIKKEIDIINDDNLINSFIANFQSSKDFSNTKFSKNLQQMLKLLLTAKCYCVLIYEGI